MSNVFSTLADLVAGQAYGPAGLGVWADGLQTASWRGVPFAVEQSQIKTGRRTALHEYPFRNVVWVEDLGQGTRTFSFQGFIAGDDVFAQRDAMVAAIETAGPGILVHPSIGSRTVSVVEFSATERAAKGRAVDLEFTFVQTVGPLFPSTIVQTQSGVLNAGAAAQIAVAADFAAATLGALQYGAGVAVQAAGTVALWVAIAGQLAGDAGALAGAVAGLPGNNGRYSGGALATLLGAGATVQTVIAGAITKKTATLAAGAAVQAAGADLGVSTAATFAAAVQALAEAVRAGANNPADQVRILVVLQNFTPVIQPGEGIGAAIATAQAATAALCRLSALISLAYACAAYQPTSSNDAQSLMALATGFLDAAITVAGDAEQDATYQAMRALRTAVVMDLTVRGANLPALITVTSNEPQPALTLAYRLYLDATRADDLVTRANPVAPMFMPLSFLALSS